MRVDAEADGPPLVGSRGHPRDPGGQVLRRTHIDELPQLWNVLRGDMTLVGPRPERPEMVAELERRFPHYTRRHLIQPGIAGWAALRCGYSGSDIGTAWKLCHDLFYIKRRSMLADVLILAETGVEVFRDAHRALRAPGDRFLLSQEPVAETAASRAASEGLRAARRQCWWSTMTGRWSRPASAPAACSGSPAAPWSAGGSTTSSSPSRASASPPSGRDCAPARRARPARSRSRRRRPWWRSSQP